GALADLLRAAIAKAEKRIVIAEEPYVGLRAMMEADQHLFFGREAEINDALEKLRASQLLAIIADSGAGKSSLVRAGLAPAFRRGAINAGQQVDPGCLWHVVTMRPGADPASGLARAVDQAAADLGVPGADRARLRDDAMSLDPTRVKFALTCDLPADQTETLLIVDQFEEVLTQAPEAAATEFLDLILALTMPGSGFRVVLTIRADYYNLLRRHQAMWSTLQKDTSRLRLGRLSDQGLAEIVARPLTLAGYDGETSSSRAAADREKQALTDRIRADVSDRPGDLALIQMALARVWEASQQGRSSLTGAYASVGGVFGALAHGADQVLATLDGDGESRLFALIARLVRPGETGGETRRTARLDEFDDDARALAQWLASDSGGRLVLVEEDRLEIAHEALIRQWSWLQARLQPVLEDVRTLHRLIERAAVWAGVSDRSPPDLDPQPDPETGAQVSAFTRRMIGASRLDQALEPGHERLALGADVEIFQTLAQRYPDWLSAVERRFVEASVGYRDGERARSAEMTRLLDRGFRMAARFGIVVVIALICAATFGWMMFESREEERAAKDAERIETIRANMRTRDLLTASSVIAGNAGDHEQAAGLALAALAAPGTALPYPEGRRALARASAHLTPPVTLTDTGRSLAEFLGATGSCLVIGSERQGLRLKALTDEEGACPAIDLKHSGTDPFTLRTIAVDPAETRIAAGARDGRITIWSLETGDVLADVRPSTAAVADLSLHPDHDMVAVTTLAGRTALLKPTPLQSIRQWNKDTTSVAISPDGDQLALGGGDGSIGLFETEFGGAIVNGGKLNSPVVDLAFSDDGRWLTAVIRDGRWVVWELSSAGMIELSAGTSDAELESVALDPLARRLAIGGFDGSI
ncbi:MAG: hypothetical protein AAGB15_12300, partial [Pseudomonadota bacterium]